MHHIYHTEGFIISSKNIGESNKIFIIYTKELGLVHAIAQGIRLNKSKLRFSLQDLSYVRVDIVRGKDVWRITSATHISSFSFARLNTESLKLIVRVSKLLERLCHGEGSNIKIFNDMIESFLLLDDVNTTQNIKDALEIHLILRIMYNLGYISNNEIVSKYLSPISLNLDSIGILLAEKKLVINQINKALTESQL